MSTESLVFKREFYPEASDSDWYDWRWQIKNRLTKAEDFSRFMALTDEEKQAMSNAFPVAVTPYYASVAARSPAVRRTVLPSLAEMTESAGENDDPLGEEPCMVTPGLVHRYPDRVLFLTTEFCSNYCRYCTRSRLVGRLKEKNGLSPVRKSMWEQAFAYIRNHPEVRDVLISGGDPLTMPDSALDYLLANLRAIPSVEMIRIGSKTPAVLPMRFTKSLLNTIKKYHPVFFSLHFTHPDEMTAETNEACDKIADAGIPTGSQTVLLRGVNDNADTLKSLMHKLLKVRVRPYYLFQCDPVKGSMHFRVPVKKGLEIIDALRGYTTGYAVPTYAIDIPGGGGKIVLTPDHVAGRDGDFLLLKNFEGKLYRYPDYETP